MSQGYNPRPRISLPVPLSTGFKGLNEVLDFELCEWRRPESVLSRLSEVLPEGLALKTLRTLPAKPGRCANHFSYRVPLLGESHLAQKNLQRLLKTEEIMVQRKRKGRIKEINVAEYLQGARVRNGSLHFSLKMTDQGTARPEEILKVLGLKPGRNYYKSAIERTRVSLSSSL